MNLFRQAAKTILSTCVAPDRLMTRGRQWSAESLPAISLTFDDGPHPEHTPRLLDRLNEFGLKGSFFVIGELAEKHPQLIRRIVAEGHELANHTWSHAEPSKISTADFMAEIRRTEDLLLDLTGQVSRFVRPPKGELTFSKMLALWKARYSVVLWSIDPRDYRMTSAQEMTRWCQGYRPASGDIVLLHDKHPWSEVLVQELGHSHLFDAWRTTHLSEWLPQHERAVPVSSLGPEESSLTRPQS